MDHLCFYTTIKRSWSHNCLLMVLNPSLLTWGILSCCFSLKIRWIFLFRIQNTIELGVAFTRDQSPRSHLHVLFLVAYGTWFVDQHFYRFLISIPSFTFLVRQKNHTHKWIRKFVNFDLDSKPIVMWASVCVQAGYTSHVLFILKLVTNDSIAAALEK